MLYGRCGPCWVIFSSGVFLSDSRWNMASLQGRGGQCCSLKRRPLSRVCSKPNQTLLTIPFSQQPSEELYKRPSHFSLGIDRCYSPLPRVQDPTGGEPHGAWGQILSVCVWSVRDFSVALWFECRFLCGWTESLCGPYTSVWGCWKTQDTSHRHTHT